MTDRFADKGSGGVNLPNRLTLIRIAAIPVFMALATEVTGPASQMLTGAGLGGFVQAYNAFVAGGGYIAAGVLFVAAFATDALDGYIARKYDMITDLGKFLDPVADKLLVIAALVVLTARGEAGAWVTVIMVSREFIITSFRLIAANKGIVLAAGGFGKAKTAVQFAALTLLLFRNFGIPALNAVFAGTVLLYIALILAIISGVDYIYKNRGLLKNPA